MFFVHVCSSLCQYIIADVTPESLCDEVHAIVDSAFSRSDKEVKQSLLSLALSICMSIRYCNAKLFAIIALFI